MRVLAGLCLLLAVGAVALLGGCSPRPAAEQPFRRAYKKMRHPKTSKPLSAWEVVASWE
jgi:uncharacterized lipoprotein